jgi:hypothetical protein
VETLLVDSSIKILEAPEFSKSIFLWGVQLPQIEADPRLDGCKTVKILSQFLEHNTSDANSSTLIDLSMDCTSSFQTQLHQTLMKLLLSESTALKFYGEATYPYLVSRSVFIDTHCLRLLENLEVQNRSPRSPSFNLSALSANLQIHNTEIVQCLETVQVELEIGMAKIVKDGEGLPALFRRKELMAYYKIVQHKLDKEGFEVVNNEDNIKFVSDNEESSESEYESDLE